MRWSLRALVIVLGVATAAADAQALCNIRGTIFRVQASSTVPFSFVYLTTQQPMTSFFYIGRTQDPMIVSAAAAAMTNQTNAFISGDVESCPLAPVRQRSIGNIRALILGP